MDQALNARKANIAATRLYEHRQSRPEESLTFSA